MKNRLIIFWLFTIIISNNSILAQKQQRTQLNGGQNTRVVIDLKNMKDTVGRFMIMLGGEIFYPKKVNDTILIEKVLKEPRRSFLAFYPQKKLAENPGKHLNEISADVSDFFYFLAITGENRIVINNSVAESEVFQPSKEQRDYFELLRLKSNFDKILEKKYSPLIKEINKEKIPAIKDSLVAVYIGYYKREFQEYYQNNILGFVRENPDAPASLVELTEYSDRPDMNLKILSLLYNNLSDRMKALPTARTIYAKLDKENFGNHLLGKPAPPFTQSNPDGKKLSLTDYKGHLTLLEFWASWCAPCREANPALVKIFNKYNRKGFKILGISLDDNRESWLKAVKDDGLVWDHASDLKFFKNSIATLYHVSSIPTNYLIDSSGKVIAYNLNEKQLREYLAKLLD